MSTTEGGRKRPRYFSFGRLTLGVVAGLVVTAVIYQVLPRHDPVRVAAWEQVKPRIDQTKEESRHEANAATVPIRKFFAERKQNARAFAAEVLSLSGKWAFVKGYFQGGSHEQYIEECFERNVFATSELKKEIESAVAGYVSEIQGRENQLLVAIRADLEASALAAPDYVPALSSEAQFRREYEAMLATILPLVCKDLGFTVTREVVSFVGSEIAATLVMQIGVALASEFGLSGGVLAVGAGAGALTFGVGLIAGILVDMALDWIIRQVGYDPEGEVAAKVSQALDRIERVILDGDPKAHEQYQKAKTSASWSFTSSGRADAEAEARSIEASGRLGLNHQLRQINDLRARLREQALQNLILEGSAQ